MAGNGIRRGAGGITRSNHQRRGSRPSAAKAQGAVNDNGPQAHISSDPLGPNGDRSAPRGGWYRCNES